MKNCNHCNAPLSWHVNGFYYYCTVCGYLTNVDEYPSDNPAMVNIYEPQMENKYPQTIWINFNSRAQEAIHFLDSEEWKWCEKMKWSLDQVLIRSHLGWCDGFGGDGSTMDIYMFVHNFSEAYPAVQQWLEENELLAFCNYVVGFGPGGSEQNRHTLYSRAPIE